MAMSLTTLCCLFLLFLSVWCKEKPSVYEALQQYSFPIGVLPEGVTSYDLDTNTGEFSAHLNRTCNFRLENSYELKYKSTVKGVITRGKITKLNGVSVKVVLLWLDIVEVRREGDNLEFSVGIASANFPVTNFEECPQCGCGLDCGLNRFVSPF